MFEFLFQFQFRELNQNILMIGFITGWIANTFIIQILGNKPRQFIAIGSFLLQGFVVIQTQNRNMVLRIIDRLSFYPMFNRPDIKDRLELGGGYVLAAICMRLFVQLLQMIDFFLIGASPGITWNLTRLVFLKYSDDLTLNINRSLLFYGLLNSVNDTVK